MKDKLQRMIALCLVAALALPLPARAVEMETAQEASAALLEQTDPDETPTDPSESSNPTEPSKTTEPTDPSETTEPTDPSETAVEMETAQETSAALLEQTDPDETPTEPPEPEGPFSCYTFDPQGNRLNGYWSETDAAWYLFVTSTMDAANTELYYTGRITDVSAGSLDRETASVTGAFEASGDTVSLTDPEGTVHDVILLQSSLPSVHITLNGTTLDEVHKDKNVKYSGNSISIMDPSGAYDLNVEKVEFKGRGNSTWMFFDKKGYQIKFDKKTSVLGMDKAKKWVLLANASDETLMHNMLAFNLASQMDMDYVSEFAYVDLWIDGEYRGNYILGEKVDLGSGRLDLQDSNGTLFEQDQGFYYEEDYWFLNDITRKYFTVKETNVDDSDAAQVQTVIDSFQDSLKDLMMYLYSTPSKDVTLSVLETMIDVDSFAKYYLINEYCCNTESTAGSFYWYKDGLDDVLHLGPIWDFDSSMGNEKSGLQYYMNSHVLFDCLLASPEFYDRTLNLYYQYKSAFDGMASSAEVFKEQIADSVSMNFVRWDVWGEPNPKNTLNDYSGSYEEGYAKLIKWLKSRAASFNVQHTNLAYTRVDEDCKVLDMFFESDQNYDLVEFMVWSDAGGQDDAKRYRAQKNPDGLWQASADLSVHQTAGKYSIHVFATVNNLMNDVADGYAYVEKTNAPEVSAKLSEDKQCLEITVRSVGSYKNVSIDVWGEPDGQNDLVNYTPEKQSDNSMTCTVNLLDHKETGIYQIQVNGTKDGTEGVICQTSVDAEDGVWPVAAAELSGDNRFLTITLRNPGVYTDIFFHVWSEVNGQDDVKEYTATKQEDGSWTADVNLSDHGDLGTYHIDAYGTRNGVKTRILQTQTDVGKVGTVPMYRLYNPYTQEHLLTVNEAEKDQLVETGWLLDGIAWSSPVTGDPVYRLYNPYDDWHTYSMSEEEIDLLTGLGWQVDGVVCCSSREEERVSIYRLYNPYEQKNYHLLTASEDERDSLLTMGWSIDGVAFFASLG